jgi:MerR family transcriptional regulator, copper efflux regulator
MWRLWSALLSKAVTVDGLLRIGELARAAGVSTRTVDYYTGLGLLEPAARTGAGYRLYHPSAALVIGEIRQLETHGVSLDEIGAALSRDPADVTQLLDRIDAEVASLRTLVESSAPHAQALLAVIGARAHALLTVAVELATATKAV